MCGQATTRDIPGARQRGCRRDRAQVLVGMPGDQKKKNAVNIKIVA